MKLSTVTIAAATLLSVAWVCGSTQRSPAAGTTSPTPPAATSPSPTGRLLAFLVPGTDQSDTVEWVMPAGGVRAKATFTAPKLSAWSNAAALLQPYARVAGGSIFYVDSQGAIKSLASDGSVKLATNLTLRSGENIVSFAVSPDGLRIAASILNHPPQRNPPPQSLADPFVEPGDWWYDYETANTGQPAQRVLSRDLGSFANGDEPSGITTVVGWDAGGPVAIADTQLAAQQPPFSSLTPGKSLVHLGPDGSHVDQVGGSSCIPLDSNKAGNAVCYSSSSPKSPQGCVTQYTVNSAAGAILWSASWPGCVYNPRLSPASDRFCTDSGTLFNQDGSQTKLPQSGSNAPETCKGWVDDSTLVLWGESTNASPEVYTFDLRSQTRDNVIDAFGTVVYLGSVGGA